MKNIIPTLILFVSVGTCADAGISGKWECESKSFPKMDGSVLTFTFEVNNDETRFSRYGTLMLETGIPSMPEIQLKTIEEGTITIDGNNLKLAPLKAELKIMKGEGVIDENDPNLMAMLIKDEEGELFIENENRFKVTILEGVAKHIHTCVKPE
ncbi:hypothetical protein [Teredinibacter turnerae]|uniref:hypothetical protein n=1 Tax=Teredinibacter turnerae TaxID=2426 RepID=UPI0030D23C55